MTLICKRRIGDCLTFECDPYQSGVRTEMDYCRVVRNAVARLLLLILATSWVTGRTGARQDNNIEVPFGAMFDKTAVVSQAALEYKLYLGGQDKKSQISLKSKQQKTKRFIDMRDVYTTNTEFCELVRQGIFAMFGTHTVDTIDSLMAYASTFHMPFISPRMPVKNTGQEMGFLLFMQPHYAAAVVQVIKQYRWSEIWYMHSTNEGLIRMQQLFDALAEEEHVLKVNVIRVSGVDDAVAKLSSIDRRRDDEDKRILLDMPARETEKLLSRQKNADQSARHHYFIMELGVNELDLSFFQHGGVNVTGFRLFDFNNNQVIRNFTNEWKLNQGDTYKRAGKTLSHEAALTMDSITLLKHAFARMRKSSPHIFKPYLRRGELIKNSTKEVACDGEPVIPWNLGYDIMKTMRESDFNGFTGRVAFDRFGLRRDYLLEILECTKGMALSHIGTWHPYRGLKMQSPSSVRLQPTHNIENRTRIVTSILTEPFLMMYEDGGNRTGNDRFYGYAAELADKMCSKLMVKCIIRNEVDNHYGAAQKNGSWNGMVGELISRKADLAIAPLTITADREKFIHFSKPFMSLGISIMIKKPEKEQPGVFSFMYPLSYEIWMCVIFAYIGVSVVLFLVSRFSPFEWHIEDNTDGPTVTNNFTIFNSLWFSLGAFMQQGCDIEPRSMSGRIVGSMWWFFTLIVISSYTANLAAFLTVQRMQSPIESAADLAKQTEIKYGSVDSGTTKEFFKTSTITTYERMWAFMESTEPSVFVGSNKLGVDRVRDDNGRYAFLVESTTNDYNNQRKPCNTMKVGNNLDSKGYGIGTPLGSDIRDKINLAVLELREDGELRKLETKWWYDMGECDRKKDGSKTTTNALKLSNVAGIFYILVGGLTLALFMAALEFLYKSHVEASRRKTSFINAVRSKARLSIKGKAERHPGYTYAPAAQLITFDGYADSNTHTQV